MLSDREKELKANFRSVQAELVAEKERCDRYLAQVRNLLLGSWDDVACGTVMFIYVQ